MGNAFLGFPPDSFAFFRELADNNNKAWFEQNRARYDEHVVGAFRGLLGTLEPFLLKLNPQFETGGKTNRSFSRINRDIRFSKDKSPCMADSSGDHQPTPARHRSDCDACLAACSSSPAQIPASTTFALPLFSDGLKRPTFLAEPLSLQPRHQPHESRAPPMRS
jgi:hypothetical protein